MWKVLDVMLDVKSATKQDILTASEAANLLHELADVRFSLRAQETTVIDERAAIGDAMRDAGVVWVVTRIEADYLSPARFEDELTVETVPEKMTTARLTMSQIVRREGRELFSAKVTAVCMDMHSGKPVRLPAEVRASL